MKSLLKNINWHLILAMVYLTAFICAVMPTGTVMASNYTGAVWRGILTVGNNGTAVTLVSANSNVTSTLLTSPGYMAADASDTTVIKATGVDVAYMPTSSGAWIFWEPSIDSNSYDSYLLYSGGATSGGKQVWFPDTAGGTVTDSATLELGNNFTVLLRGYFYTEETFSYKYPVQKAGAIEVRAANSTVTAEIIGGPTCAVSIANYDGSIVLSSDGTDLTLQLVDTTHDLNSDGYITAADNTLITDWVLFHGAEYRADYDLNGDLDISLADSTALNLWALNHSDTQPLGGTSVPDNASDYIFAADEAMPYVGSNYTCSMLKTYVGGALRQDISFSFDATTGGNFTDQSGNGHDLIGAIRTDSTDADVFVTLTDFKPITPAIAPAYALTTGTSSFITGGTMAGNFSTTVAPTFPGADLFVEMATAGSVPVQLPLMIISCVGILIISLLSSWVMKRFGNGNLIIKIAIIMCSMGILIGVGVYDFWMLMVFGILAAAIGFASQQQRGIT